MGVSYIPVSKICCNSKKMEQLVIQHKFPFKSSGQCFRARSFLVSRTSSSPLAHLALQYQTTRNKDANKICIEKSQGKEPLLHQM